MDAVQGLNLSTALEDDHVVVYVSGELDYASVPRLMEAVRATILESVCVYYIDCAGVTFIDSEIMKAIILLKREFSEAGKTLHLSECSGQVNRVLSLLGISECLDLSMSA